MNVEKIHGRREQCLQCSAKAVYEPSNRVEVRDITSAESSNVCVCLLPSVIDAVARLEVLKFARCFERQMP